jgi:lipopolysaccharide biosynthesis regulator YciM
MTWLIVILAWIILQLPVAVLLGRVMGRRARQQLAEQDPDIEAMYHVVRCEPDARGDP